MDIKVNKATVVVFDLDDTLYNELDYLKSAYQHIALFLEPHNWKPLYASMFSLYRRGENVFNKLAAQYNVDKAVLIDKYRYHKPNLYLFKGVLELMQAITSKNGKLALITDGRTKTQTAKLKALGIYELFDVIVISEAIGSEKPNETNFKAVVSAIKGENYWYIADNLRKDFIAPNALGWNSVALIDNGKNIHHQSHAYMNETHQPKHYILDYAELRII